MGDKILPWNLNREDIVNKLLQKNLSITSRKSSNYPNKVDYKKDDDVNKNQFNEDASSLVLVFHLI